VQRPYPRGGGGRVVEPHRTRTRRCVVQLKPFAKERKFIATLPDRISLARVVKTRKHYENVDSCWFFSHSIQFAHAASLSSRNTQNVQPVAAVKGGYSVPKVLPANGCLSAYRAVKRKLIQRLVCPMSVASQRLRPCIGQDRWLASSHWVETRKWSLGQDRQSRLRKSEVDVVCVRSRSQKGLKMPASIHTHIEYSDCHIE
jgi:hypothetical protein